MILSESGRMPLKGLGERGRSIPGRIFTAYQLKNGDRVDIRIYVSLHKSAHDVEPPTIFFPFAFDLASAAVEPQNDDQ